MPTPEVLSPVSAQPAAATDVKTEATKETWVTPVVRDYDPAETTRAGFTGVGADFGIYS